KDSNRKNLNKRNNVKIMNKLLLTNKELKSLQIVIQYLLDNESKHYEECNSQEKSKHIYKHTKLLEQCFLSN
ncbi:MAG: hypothetical protein PSN36_01585, partial [Gammaproteobacteria bacterium]|nr:hypothetical protein [Gammaproteobacteria bacterium]